MIIPRMGIHVHSHLPSGRAVIQLLVVVTTLYIGFPEPIHLITESMYPLINLPHFPELPQTLESAIVFSASVTLTFSDPTYE